MALKERQQLKFMPTESTNGERSEPDTTHRLSVGSLLRAERERRNLSLDDVSANLRIRRAQLEAIEEGRFKDLPGAPYAVGFVRAYAEFLELDRDDIVRRFKTEAAELNNRKELHFPRPIKESRMPGGVVLVVSVLIAAGAYGLWYTQRTSDQPELPRVTAVPERMMPLAETAPPNQTDTQTTDTQTEVAMPAAPPADGSEAPASVTSSEVARTVDTDADVSSPAEVPPATMTDADSTSAATGAFETAPTDGVVAITPGSAEDSAPPQPPSDAPPQPRVFGETSGQSRVVLRATADSWIQIRDGGGNIVFSRILRAGDSYNVPNRGDLVLITGNAGALEVQVDGKALPPLGRVGAVRRDIALDPDRLLAGTAVPEQTRPATSEAGPAPTDQRSPAPAGD